MRSALEKKQAPPEWALKDPDFEFIRGEPEFQVLIDEFAEKGGGCGGMNTPAPVLRRFV